MTHARTNTIWQQADEPGQHEFTITVTPDAQTVGLDTPDSPHTWTLPAG